MSTSTSTSSHPADQPQRQMPPQLGLSQLSLLTAEPPRLVALAAEAGFDFVGVRVRPVTDKEKPFNVQPGTPLLAETLSRMADTGVTVKDIEFLLLDGSDQRDAWMQMLEAGQALGASSMTIAVSDTETQRVIDTLGQMAQDGRAYGITPALEAISYQAVNSLPQAGTIAEQAGIDVLIDTLHVGRFGGTTEELRAVGHQVPLVQLCDAPAQRPADREGLVLESRSVRLPAGEGGLELLSVVDAVNAGKSAAGLPSVPVSVEIPNDDAQRRLGDSGWIKHLYHSTLNLFGSAERSGDHS